MSKKRPRAAQANMPDILRALTDEHTYQLRVFRLLEKQVAALNLGQQPDYEVMHGVMRYMTQYPDRFHHPKEDLVFDKLVQRDPASVPEVHHLLEDHVQILARGAELLALIDRCRADPAAADTLALRKSAHAYIGRLRRHMDVEELRLFPRARQVLRPRDWAEVEERMKPILDPVFGAATADEFAALRAQELRSHGEGARRAAQSSWVEAAAAVESISALLAGAAEVHARLSRHHREALRANATFARGLLRTQPLRRRVGLVCEACASNSRMARDVVRQLGVVWFDALKSAARPYREGDTYAARLFHAVGRRIRLRSQPVAAGKSSVK